MGVVFKNRRWVQVPFTSHAGAAVPAISGVYAYVEMIMAGALPISFEWVYIGKAINLSRRLEQHEDLREPNKELVRWIKTASNSHVWYSPVQPSDLATVERELIRMVSPRFNRILYWKGEKK